MEDVDGRLSVSETSVPTIGWKNKYDIFKNGVEYIVRDHNKKTNLSLVNARQMKRLVSSSKNLMLLMIKP